LINKSLLIILVTVFYYFGYIVFNPKNKRQMQFLIFFLFATSLAQSQAADSSFKWGYTESDGPQKCGGICA
jgi:hypothetical protein